MKNLKFKRIKEAVTIYDNATVKVTQMNHVIEVVYVARESDVLERYKKIDKEHYVVIDFKTGEATEKKYKINENRAENTAGLKRTFKKIRDIINNNFSGASNELFITLTYCLIDGQPMNEIKKASRDFDVFIKRFRRKYSDLEYLAVLEPQANSAWHWHVLAKFTSWSKKKHINIDNNSIIEPLWGHGFTNTKRLNKVDNIGAYLGGYLGDIEINQENKDELFDALYKNARDIVIKEKEVKDDNGKKANKKYIKGGRLHLYPSGANIYRYSKGIIKPIPQKMIYSEAKIIIGDKEPDYSSTINIIDTTDSEDEKLLNIISYESYNLKRTDKK